MANPDRTHIRRRLEQALATLVSGARPYYRRRHGSRLAGEVGGAETLAELERLLAGERARGRIGHWTYEPGRQIALMQAIAGERLRRASDGEPR
jgi:hypothetical protein